MKIDMQKNNPYTVPEGFFEQSYKAIDGRVRVIRQRRRRAIGGIAGLCVALGVFFTVSRIYDRPDQALTESEYSELLAFTEYDIFLQNIE